MEITYKLSGKKPIFYNSKIDLWLQEMKKYMIKDCNKIGCIVMNCNPFTLGHQYLIETASKQVGHLYVFVVEEDKSFFKFKDRLRLVVDGTKKFTNVSVLPSGSFMISETTLPGYFEKDVLQNIVVDATEDIEIFSRRIAPEFGITVRFAGEEPTDKYTMQYNHAMKTELPKYDIEFVEIPRKEIKGEPISASTVRKYLKEGEFQSIEALVPETTYQFLRNRYGMENIDVNSLH